MKSLKVLEKLNIGFLGSFSESDLKRMKKKLKESKKHAVNGRKREFYLTEYIGVEYLYTFVQIQNEYFKFKVIEERDRSTEFLFNEEESINAGFYSEDFENAAHKRAELEVDLLSCPEGENESKFRRKQLKAILKRLIPEQTDSQVLEWANKAYPSIQDDLWEIEVEEALVSLSL